jgi:hypothetical protein
LFGFGQNGPGPAGPATQFNQQLGSNPFPWGLGGQNNQVNDDATARNWGAWPDNV